jgi:NAD(P)H-flavin reductase
VRRASHILLHVTHRLLGVTPHVQLIRKILGTPGDKTEISLIDSNHSFGDILLYDELVQYAKDKPNQLKLWFVLSKKPEDREWPYSEGHLDQKMMKEHFYHPEDDKVGTFL